MLEPESALASGTLAARRPVQESSNGKYPGIWFLRTTHWFRRLVASEFSTVESADAHARLKFLAVAPTQMQSRAVFQTDLILTGFIHLHTADLLKVNDRGAMNTHKSLGIEFSF